MQGIDKALSSFYNKSIIAVARKIDGRYLQGKLMRKLKKPVLILFTVFILFAGLVIAFISPITKYLVEKYDLKYTGRQITMNWAYVNPFTGYVHFSGLKIYEFESDSVFLSVKGVSANFEMRKMLSKTYEISELTLNHPRGIIIQIDSVINFDDLIMRFKPKANPIKRGSPVHFNMLKINIIDGEFYYRERVTPINYFIKKVNIESPGLRWDSDTIAAKYSFLSGIGSGGMKGDFAINTKNLDYRLAVEARKFDLNILEQYLRDLTNFGYFSGNIDSDLDVKGSFKKAENVKFTGMVAINDFHAGEKPGEDYASFLKLTLAIFDLSPINHKYLFDSVSLNNPYFKYERYDYLDNLTRMFISENNNSAVGQSDTKFNLVLEIGNYIKRLSQNFFRSNYKINRLAIYRGDLEFSDYSVSEKFSVHLNPIFVLADSITKNHKRVSVLFHSGIQPYGNMSVALSINPNDSSDFDLEYHLRNLPVPMFNPYIITYTSFPLDRGTIAINGAWHVRKGIISSNNHLLIIDPRLTKRYKNRDSKWIPMRLLMALIRERGNVIDYEIPISGNLNNPEFHIKDVIFDILGNIFIKPATTPYIMEVKSTETQIEKSLTIKWEMRNNTLKPQQVRFVERMADFLGENPGASITASPRLYAVKEKEYILFYEAKKKYFLATNHKNAKSYSVEDSEKVDEMSIRDPKFVRYLNIQTQDSMLFTLQEKCARLIGWAIIDSRYRQLNKERETAFISIFKNKGVEKHVKITADQIVTPYNGFSYYKIDYKGEFPESLMKAYREMNDLNSKAPREMFKKERKKNKAAL